MASEATAAQIAEYDGGRRKIVAHLGSARTEAELEIRVPKEQSQDLALVLGTQDRQE